MMIVINTAYVYLIIGVLFAIVFVIKGVQVIDKDTEGASIGFRLLIVPGSILLWPVLLRGWIKSKK